MKKRLYKIFLGALGIAYLYAPPSYNELLQKFLATKRGVIFGENVVGGIEVPGACTIENWNNVQEYACRCCLVKAVENAGTSLNASQILSTCSTKEGVCTQALIAQLRTQEGLAGISDADFLWALYDSSRVIKDATPIIPQSLKSGKLDENNLKELLVALYTNKRLFDKAFARGDCLTVKNLAGEGGFATRALFRVSSSCDGQKRSFIVKEMSGEKKESFDLTFAAHYKPLKSYIAPQSVPNFPIIDLPIAYIFYQAQGDHYLSIMPTAQGEEFLKIMNRYINNKSNENKALLQKGYAALGRALGNFHKKFMDKDSIDGKTITHGDLHARNFFYDAAKDAIYWIDNERIGKATLERGSPYNDLNYALYAPFWKDNNFLNFNANIRQNPKPWFTDFYTPFFAEYIKAFGGDQKQRLEELDRLLSRGDKVFYELAKEALGRSSKAASAPTASTPPALSISKRIMKVVGNSPKDCPTACQNLAAGTWTGKWDNKVCDCNF